jgi:HEAT repeat protein
MLALAAAPAAPAAPQQQTLPKATARRVYEIIDSIKRPGSPAQLQRALDDLVARGPAVTPIVLQEMGKRDRQTFVRMIYVLGRLGNRSTRSVLWDIARQEKGVVGHWAHYALAMQGEVTSVRQVVRSASATTSFVPGGTAADFVAGVVGPPAVPVLLEELPNRAGPGLIAGVAALGTLADPRATPFLLLQLESDDPELQRVALAALARIGAPEAAAPATRLLRSGDSLVRGAAADALSYLRWPGALSELRRSATEDPATAVRRKATWALGKVGGAAAVATLASMAGEGADAVYRDIAVQALGETGVPEAAAPLLKIALRQADKTGLLAVQALGRLASPAADDALARLAREARGSRIRAEAALALQDRRPSAAAEAALDLLLGDDAAPPGHPDVLRRLLHLVAREGGAEAAGRIQRALQAGVVGVDLTEALWESKARLEHGDDRQAWCGVLRAGGERDVRLAARRLGEIGDPRAVDDLVTAFGRVEPHLAHELVTALGRIGDPEAVEFLAGLVSDELYDVPSLRKARLCAAWSLARCGAGEAAVEALETMARRGGQETVAALVAIAVIRGEESLDDLYLFKRNILRRATPEAVSAHESVNWVIRQVRAGRPLDRLDRPPK